MLAQAGLHQSKGGLPLIGVHVLDLQTLPLGERNEVPLEPGRVVEAHRRLVALRVVERGEELVGVGDHVGAGSSQQAERACPDGDQGQAKNDGGRAACHGDRTLGRWDVIRMAVVCSAGTSISGRGRRQHADATNAGAARAWP